MRTESMFDLLRQMTHAILKNPERSNWTLQGFGMMRTYISKELRLHVWSHGHRIQDVTDIHDHPWDFESLVLSGTIANTRYDVLPCHHSDEQVAAGRLRTPFLKSTIVCGVGGGNHVASIKERGERVWLAPRPTETYSTSTSYKQKADEVHHTSFGSGTVTLVRRVFQPDTEHAHVFFKADSEWVSAEPRDATPAEVADICKVALERW